MIILIKNLIDRFLQQLTMPHKAWWLSWPVGYCVALVTSLISFIPMWILYRLGTVDFHVDAPYFFFLILVGYIWGAGPGFIIIIVREIFTELVLVPPPYRLVLFTWPGGVTCWTFIFIECLVLWLAIILRKHQERQQMIQFELQQANKSKDFFLSQASHELKTPLTTLRGEAQIALRRLAKCGPLPETHSFLGKHLKYIEQHTRSLDRLVTDILDLGSMRTGKMTFQETTCDLEQTCQEIIEDHLFLSEREIMLHTQSSDGYLVRGDPLRLSQVLTNLLTNALKYSPEETPIRVALVEKQEQLVLSVHNDGSTILARDKQKIFEPFYRAAAAEASETQGFGLGLAITRGIVEKHHGIIWVESGEEQGTTFFVQLPALRHEKSYTQGNCPASIERR